MSRRFHVSGHAPFARPPMPAHRRRHIHGPLQPMAAPPAARGRQVRQPGCTAMLGIAVAAFTALYFAAQLLRPILGRMF